MNKDDIKGMVVLATTTAVSFTLGWFLYLLLIIIYDYFQ